MPSELASALALAVAKASLAGDRATVIRLLGAAAEAGETSASASASTFADAPTKKGRWGMSLGKLIGYLTGRKSAEQKHQDEHAKQRAGFEPDEVLPAETLTPNEMKVWNGEKVLTPFSTCVYSVLFDKGDGYGGRTRTYITFKPSGDIYVYYDVPFGTVMEEIDTDSAGRGVWRWFRYGKSGGYKSRYGGHKVGQEELSKGEKKQVKASNIISWGKIKKP